MATAPIYQIADAVTAQLNAGSFALEFAAVTVDEAVIEPAKAKELRVEVMPGTRADSQLSRGMKQLGYTVTIVVQKKLTAPGGEDEEKTNQVRELTAFVESLADSFSPGRLEGYASAQWIGNNLDPVFDREWMQSRMFASALEVTYADAR